MADMRTLNNQKSEGAQAWRRPARGIGYVLLWLIGVPLPIILLIMLFRGC
jgi:hypothetical protein